jgi:hypothetical protein
MPQGNIVNILAVSPIENEPWFKPFIAILVFINIEALWIGAKAIANGNKKWGWPMMICVFTPGLQLVTPFILAAYIIRKRQKT